MKENLRAVWLIFLAISSIMSAMLCMFAIFEAEWSEATLWLLMSAYLRYLNEEPS